MLLTWNHQGQKQRYFILAERHSIECFALLAYKRCSLDCLWIKFPVFYNGNLTKKNYTEKNSSSLQHPHCLVRTPEWLSSQVTFSEVSKCGVHLTWLLPLRAVSLSEDAPSGGLFCPSGTWAVSLAEYTSWLYFATCEGPWTSKVPEP